MSLLVFAVAAAALLSEAVAVPAQFDSLVAQLRRPLYVDHAEHAISAYRLSRDILQARWGESWHEELPCSEPHHSGLVQKAGAGTQSPTLRLRIQDSDKFVNEKLPIYVGCQVCPLFGIDPFMMRPRAPSTAQPPSLQPHVYAVKRSLDPYKAML